MEELFSFDPYEVALTVVGLALLLEIWLPQFILKRHIAVPLLHLATGALLFSIHPTLLPVDPFLDTEGRIWEHVTEAVVVISLVGVGLRIDERSHASWGVTLRLLLVTMPLTIAGVAVLGWWWVGLSVPAAVLLGAVLAPTDPVLASDVQVGPPNEGDGNNVRFALSSEAGLNDGLAFPFTYLAIGAALYGTSDLEWLGTWAWRDLGYRVAVGFAMGYAMGRVLAAIIYEIPKDAPVAVARLGYVALSVFLLAYGVTELVGGYGFIAAFVTAFIIRRAAFQHDYNATLSEFAENVENAASGLLLILLGGLALEVLPYLSWHGVGVGLALVFIVRPLSGLVALIGDKAPFKRRAAVSFYGIRGVGSVYYLSYAFNKAEFGSFDVEREIWAIVTFVIIVSAVVHGLTAVPVMRHIDGDHI